MSDADKAMKFFSPDQNLTRREILSFAKDANIGDVKGNIIRFRDNSVIGVTSTGFLLKLYK